MEGSSKGEEETGFAALFNEFVSKVQTEPKSSPEVEETNSDPEDDKQEVHEKSKDDKGHIEGESSHSENKTEVPLSEDNSDIKMESYEHEKESGTSDKDQLQTSSKHSSTLESEETVPATGSEENVIADANIQRSKQLLRGASSQESSPQSIRQESSPIPSNSDSSYQTSPASSTLSSTIITPASSPLTTLQSRSTILSAASSKLSSSSSRRVPSKVEKPVLRDRAGRKRYNSLESEFVVNIDVRRERSKSGAVSQSSNRRRQSRADREGPRYRNQRGKPTPKPEERKRPQEKVMRPGLEFVVGFKLEAMDFCQNKWYAAKIVQVDEEDQQVLIHFEKWNSRYDEWIDCESERLRPLVRQSTRKETQPQQHPTGEYKYGEEVLARWSDCRYYPAKVLNINKNGTYRMLFYDGIEKNVLATNIRVMPDELKAQNFFSNFTLPPAPPVKGKKRWFAKEENFPAPTQQPDTTPEPTTPTATTTKRRLSSGPTSPLSPLPVPSKKVKVDEKVKSPKEVKTPKTKVAAPPASTEPIPESQASSDVGVPIMVDPKPVLKPVLSSAKMEELISRNIKEPLLNDKDLGLLRDRRKKILAPKELVIDLDHNKYKCDVKGCDKSFRKSTLLEYHKKYYHATKTSTSSAASRVLHRTRKRMTGSRSDSRSRRRSKGIQRKRLSAPADLVSSYPTRRADRSLVKKGVVSPGAVPADESPKSPQADRRSSRIRHHSAPLQTQVPETRIKPRPPEKAASDPKMEDPVASVKSQGTTEEAVNSAEVAPKKQEEVAPETVSKEVEMKSPSVEKVEKVYETRHQYAKKPDETSSSLKQALDTSRELAEKTDKEEVPLVREMKSILKDVSMLQEEIRKEEERHRHRRKHKKNKDRKRRKKKKKDKEKKRRTKVKEKTGDDGSDEDTDTEEEDEQRKEERRLPLNDDTPSRILFKQPSQVTEVKRHPTATFRSLVGVDDDVVKCICKNTQEEGFMIQCEVCNCWQHSTCVGLSDKSVPKTYACFYCHVSRGGMPPFYDSETYEWFESGSLPRFPNFGKERSHQQEKWDKSFRLTTNGLIADLLMLAEVLQSLQHKISILQNPDHPEAKLWAKDWILRSRKEAAASVTDCGMSDDLASTLKEMFSLGKLLQQGEGSHLGEGSERSGLLYGGIGPIAGEGDAVSSSMDEHFEGDSKKGTGVPMDHIMATDGTVEVLSGGDGVSGGMKGMDETEAAIHSESSTSIGADLAGTSVQGSQSTNMGGEGVPVSSNDDGTQARSNPQLHPAVTQSEPQSVSTSQESSGVTSKVGDMVTSSLDGVTLTQTKQTKESSGDTSDVAVREKSSGSDMQEIDENSESTETRVLPQTQVAQNVDTVAGSTDENINLSEPADISHQSITASNSSKSPDVVSGNQDIPTVSSVITSTSVLKKELPSTEQKALASDSKQEMGVVSGSDKSVSQKEVSGADYNPIAHGSEPSTGEFPHGQNTELSKPVQSFQPVEDQATPHATSTEILISDKSSTPVMTDSSKVKGNERVVKGDDSVALVSGSDDSVGMDPTNAKSSEESQSDGKKMVLNVEDVIRRQMSKDNPEASKPTENESEGDEMSLTGAPTYEDTDRQEVEPMDVDNTNSQDKDAESSVEPGTELVSENVVHEEGLEDVNVEVSQAYLLRHINTLHDQLSERMNLIEMEVEKLEKMFFSSASEWQAITQDQTVMKKKMRVLLGDLHKINTIVSL